MSIKYKLSLLIFFSCVLVLMTIKLLTPYFLNRDFINKAKEEHYIRFSKEIQHFIATEGEWGTAAANGQFIDSIQPSEAKSNHIPGGPRNSAPPSNNKQQFRFGLTDHNGIALIPFYRYKPGDKVSASDIKKGDAIYLKDVIVAYAISDGIATISEENKVLIKSINKIIDYNIIVALIIALIVGLSSGTKMTQSLIILTSAAKSLGEGLNGQQITNINSKDEIGVLANVLNKMSLELERSHNKIKELSVTDELTGLYNRRFFNEQLKVILPNSFRDNQPISLVLGDIDFFKNVNDDFSHLIGDDVLKEISTIINNCLREGDILARFGGEEFILALHDTDSETALLIIERIRIKIQNYNWEKLGIGLKISMSFGICTKKNPTDYKAMLQIADEKLYLAKTSGRNKTVIN